MKLLKLGVAVLALAALCSAPAPSRAAGIQNVYLPLIARDIPPARLGPFGASVLTLATDPVHPGVLYAGTWGNGVYKSQDYAQTWAPINNGMNNLQIQALAVDYQNPNYVYAGTYYNAAVYSGVYHSPDGGQTWHGGGEMLNYYNGSPVARPVVYALAADPNNGGVVYAGTRMKALDPNNANILGGGGVFKTSDHGASWSTANVGLPANDLYVYSLTVDPADSNNVYVAMHETGAFASSDGGAGWRSINWADWYNWGDVISGRAIALNPFSPQNLLFGVWHRQGVFRSANGGASWNNSGLADLRINSINASAVQPGTFYASAFYQSTYTGVSDPASVYKTTNNGGSWTNVASNVGSVMVAPDPFDSNYVYVAIPTAGVTRSTDGGASWNGANWGLSGYPIAAAAVDPSNASTLYAAASTSGVMKSTDRGASWSAASAGLPANPELTALMIDPSNPQTLYTAVKTAGVYISQNGGGSWSLVSAGFPAGAALPASAAAQGAPTGPLANRSIPPLSERDAEIPGEAAQAQTGLIQPRQTSAAATVLALAVSPTRAALAGTQGAGVTRLQGSTWSATSLSSGSVYALLFAADGRVFAGGDTASGSLRISSDDGRTWGAAISGLSGRVVYALAQSPLQPLLFYAGTDAGLYRSEDGGSTWASAGLADQAVTAVCASSSAADALLAGSAASLYASTDRAASWISIEPTLDHFDVQSIQRDPAAQGSFYLATSFGGVVRIMR